MTKEQTEEKINNKPYPGAKEKKPKYILIIILNIIITLSSLYVYHNYILLPSQNNKTIVGVDIKGILEKQKNGLVNGKISEEQFKANMDKLEAAVNDLGKTKVVLMGDVILRGAEIIDIQ